MKFSNKEKLVYRMTAFSKAVDSLETALLLPISDDRCEIDATIYRFSLSYELAWRTLRSFLLEVYGIAIDSPKEALREAFQQRLIDDEQVWISMMEDTNKVMESFDPKISDYLYEVIKSNYFPVLKKTMLTLKEKFGSESC